MDLLLSERYAVAATRAKAEQLARDQNVRRQSVVAAECKLRFLQQRGWRTSGLVVKVMYRSVESLVERVLFAEHHRCAPRRMAFIPTIAYHICNGTRVTVCTSARFGRAAA